MLFYPGHNVAQHPMDFVHYLENVSKVPCCALSVSSYTHAIQMKCVYEGLPPVCVILQTTISTLRAGLKRARRELLYATADDPLVRTAV